MGPLSVGTARRAKPGQSQCGDRCAHWTGRAGVVVAIADGLGSGPEAAQAAQAALAYLGRHLDDPFSELFSDCDQALRHTRGVALGVARFGSELQSLDYAAVGNIRALLLRAQGRPRTLLSASPGIVGGGFRSIRPETLEVARGDRLILCTDGIDLEFDHSDLSGALRVEPQPLADAVLRDWALGHDDAAVLVYGIAESSCSD